MLTFLPVFFFYSLLCVLACMNIFTVVVWCHNLAGSALEYIDLVAGTSENRAYHDRRRYFYSDCTGTMTYYTPYQTWFSKLRINVQVNR